MNRIGLTPHNSDIVSEINDLSILYVNLFHTQSCTDADGDKETTKLIVTDIATGEANSIRWSECQNDSDNLNLMVQLDSFREYFRTIISSTLKDSCG